MHLANIAKEQGAEVGEGSTGKVGVARDRRSWNAHVQSRLVARGREKSVEREGWRRSARISPILINDDQRCRSFLSKRVTFVLGTRKKKKKRKETKYSDPS